jgi:dihydroxyacid dehydratase/phosphogluconate dehydratase
MNSLAEALGMSLPGCAAIPAPYRERGQIAYETGKRIVEMVWEDLKPSDILTRKAFENCIVVNSAIGGSTNAPIHINALARHIGVELSIDDWQKHGHDVPLLVNMQPAGFYLGEEYHRAGGVPAVVRELMKHKRIHEDAKTVNGRSHGRELPRGTRADRRRDLELRQAAGEGCRLRRAARQSLRFRDHEDQRDLEGIPRPLSEQSRRSRMRGRAAPSCSRGRKIITSASTMPRSRSTSTACCSSAAPARSAIPAAPRS